MQETYGENATLIRKPNISAPNVEWYIKEWIKERKDYTDNLGLHNSESR